MNKNIFILWLTGEMALVAILAIGSYSFLKYIQEKILRMHLELDIGTMLNILGASTQLYR